MNDKHTYPFDPSDWATITPLFAALDDTLVSSEDFAAWLARWNTLDIAVHEAERVNS